LEPCGENLLLTTTSGKKGRVANALGFSDKFNYKYTKCLKILNPKSCTNNGEINKVDNEIASCR